MGRTMYSDQITRSDAFLSMPVSARELYFQVLSDADNDGFVDNPRSLVKMLGASFDDYNLLVFKKFIIEFESGVIVIKHWRIHNLMRMDRYKPTVYQKELAMLDLKENKAYTLKEIDINLFKKEQEKISENKSWQPNGNQVAPQINISKDKLSKENIRKEKILKDKEDSSELNPQSSQIFIELPALKKDFIVTEEFIKELQELYPAVDAQTEIKKMKGWLISHPKNRKSNTKAFITNWLGREQDRASKSNSNNSINNSTIKKEGEQEDEFKDWAKVSMQNM